MANEKIRFDLTASDQTAAAFNAILGRLDSVDKSAQRTSQSAANVGRAFTTAFAGISIASVASQFKQLTDEFTNVTSRLANVTNGTANLADVQKQLFNTAQNNRTAFSQTADLYSSLARSTRDLGVPQEKLLKLTDGIGKALIVSGASGQSATAALMQLGQGFSAGALRGQEFVSVQEQAPEILRTVSRALNITTGDLKKMSEEGKLTTDVFINAFLKGLPELERQAANMPTTIGGSLTRVSNSFSQLVGEMDKTTGASKNIAEAISSVAKSIADMVTYQGAVAGVVTSLLTLTTLGLAVANVGMLSGALAALGAFLLSPAGLAVMAIAGVAGIATWAGTRTQDTKELQNELERVDALLKSGNLLEQRRLDLIRKRADLMSQLPNDNESAAETNRLRNVGRASIKTGPIKTKEQEAAEKKLADFLRKQNDEVIKLTQGERALEEVIAKRNGLSGDALKKYMAEYDLLERTKQKQKDDEIDLQDRRRFTLDLIKDANKAEQDRIKLNEKQVESGDKALNYLEKYREDMDIILEQIQLKNDGVFRTAEEQLIENSRLQLTKKFNEEIVKIKNLDNLTEQGKANAIAAANLKYEEQLGLVKELAAERIKDRENLLKGATLGVANYLDEISNFAKFTEDATTRALRGMEDSLVRFVQTGKLSFKDMANSIIADLIRIQLRQSIMAPLTTLLPNLFNTSSPQLPGVVMGGPSYENGGYTGDGARSGGLDGKGGFMAMLHPNETVIDHTKGQGGGVVVNQVINVTTGVQQTVRAEIMTLMPQIAGAAKAAVADAKMRGGGYAAAMR